VDDHVFNFAFFFTLGVEEGTPHSLPVAQYVASEEARKTVCDSPSCFALPIVPSGASNPHAYRKNVTTTARHFLES
jgi:hypothetical protein